MTADRTAGASVAGDQQDAPPLLELRGVGKEFQSGRSRDAQRTVALDGLSLTLAQSPPRIVALAGESGSGKTTAANLILGFLSPTRGEVLYRGDSIDSLKRAAKTEFRREVQAIMQDPYAAFNPFYRVGRVFDIVVKNFDIAPSRAEAQERVDEAIRFVNLDPGRILDAYPHQLSGGERQRAMVARAFLLRPRLIVADEPVSMVDASLRATILELMLRMRMELEVSFVYITHDLSTAYRIADHLIILRHGRVVEEGDPRTVIDDPKHPYTRLLVASIPIADPDDRWQGRMKELHAELAAAEGEQPAAVEGQGS